MGPHYDSAYLLQQSIREMADRTLDRAPQDRSHALRWTHALAILLVVSLPSLLV